MKGIHMVGSVALVLIVIALAALYVLPVDSKQVSADALGSQHGAGEVAQGADKVRERYRELVNPSGFVNTPSTSSGQATPITIGEFVGEKVILLDFLTYSCINCQRTFPYLNAWHEKYQDQGLLVLSIHTPEFAFEKDIKNVREAMRQYGITHPVVLDNDYATWNAWGNRYWPRKYLIDIHGNVVFDHIGEGAYEETEQKIQELLAERAALLSGDIQ